jgi:hypothetical protein
MLAPNGRDREAFVRMHLFLEEKESIPRLISSTFNIPVDQWLRVETPSNIPASTGKLLFCYLTEEFFYQSWLGLLN